MPDVGGGQRLYPTTPSPYKQYPGLYFPPTDSSEDRNPLKNYDFIIGNKHFESFQKLLIDEIKTVQSQFDFLQAMMK